MTFNSYKPFKKRNLLPRYIVIFLLGISFTLFFSSALNIVTDIKNATQYIKEIILTSDGSAKGTTGIIIDGNTSGGRIGSELYCTRDFSKCINVIGLVQTGDLTGFIKTGDLTTELNEFKSTQMDPPIGELSGKISGISGSLSLYAKLTELSNYATTGSLLPLATKNELSNYTTTGDTERIDTDTATLFTTLNTIIDNYRDRGATDLNSLFSGVDTISRE